MIGKLRRSCLFVLAITTVTQASARQTDTLGQYYKYIYAAEKSIMQKNYKRAAANYDTAFFTGFHPFATDIYNNALCAKYNHDNVAMLEMAVRLVMKGADMPYFDTTGVFTEFQGTGEYNQLKDMYPMLKQQRSKRIDSTLVKRIRAFIDRDQAVHCFLPQNAKDVAFVDSMHRLDDSLSESLKNLMLAHDYLNEDLIGADFSDGCLSFDPIYEVLVLHQFQKDGKLLRNVVDSAIRKGKIRSETGLNWIDNSSGMPHIIYTGDYRVMNDTLWMTYLKDEIQTKMIVRLLKYTDANTLKLRSYYYVDEPDSVIEKIKYDYRQYLAGKRNKKALSFMMLSSFSYLLETRPEGFNENHLMVDAGN